MCGLMMPCLVPLFMPRASVRSTAARRRLAWALLSKNILSSDLLRLSKRQRLQELLLALKTWLARPSPQPLLQRDDALLKAANHMFGELDRLADHGQLKRCSEL